MVHKILHAPPPGGPSGILTRPQAADLLQVSPRTVDLLLDSGYLPDLGIERVLRAARTPYLEVVDADQPVLRQALAKPEPERPDVRPFMGESATLSDADVVLADCMWWRADPDLVVKAELLPVTVGGFVVTVLWVRGVASAERVLLEAGGGSRRRSRDVTHVRYAFEATLAGRVRALGEPGRDYVDPTLPPELADAARVMLGARSTARSGGPIAYVPRR